MDFSVKYINLTEYKQALLRLWNECFAEDRDFIAPFFVDTNLPVDCIAVLEDSVPVSAAYCFPAHFFVNGQELNARYIYGVGTAAAYRGRGFAATMLQTAAKQTDADLFFLYPANESLRSFYARIGYRDCLTQGKRQFLSPFNYDDLQSACTITPFDATVYSAKREAFLSAQTLSHASFPNAVLQILLRHAQYLQAGDSSALLIQTDNTVYLPEVLTDSQEYDAVCASVHHAFPSKNIVISDPTLLEKSAMILPISAIAKKCFDNITDTRFFGTVFDV